VADGTGTAQVWGIRTNTGRGVAANTGCRGVTGDHTLPPAGPPSAPVRNGQLGALLDHVARPDPVGARAGF